VLDAVATGQFQALRDRGHLQCRRRIFAADRAARFDVARIGRQEFSQFGRDQFKCQFLPRTQTAACSQMGRT
jgi:hypothetical protein